MSNDQPRDPWDTPLFPEQRCASCKHWIAGRLYDGPKVRRLDASWCSRFAWPLGENERSSEKLRIVSNDERARIVTRHDFGCTEWERASDDELRDPHWERVKAQRANTSHLRRVK